MKRIKSSIPTLIVACLCSFLLLHYFISSLKHAAVPHPHLGGWVAMTLVAIATYVLIKAFKDLTKSYFYSATWLMLLLSWLLWKNDLSTGLTASIGIALYRSFIIVLLITACISFFLSISKNGAISKRISASTVWASTTLVATVVALSLLWFSLTDFVWYWDYSGYSDITKNLFHTLTDYGYKNVADAIAASLKNEYSYIPAVPLLVTEEIFGTSARAIFIFAIALLYVSPTILIMAYLFYKFSQQRMSGRLALLISIVSLSLFPLIFQIGLYGMPDIGGLIFLGAIIASLFPGAHADDYRQHIASLIIVAVLFFLLCVFRRWYVFIVFPVMFLKIVTELRIKTLLESTNSLYERTFCLGVLFSTLLLIGVCFCWDRFLIVVNGGYREAYHAYATDAAVTIASAVNIVGYGPFVIASLIIGSMAVSKNMKLVALAISFVLVTTVFLFLNVQGFSWHHYLLVLPVLAFAVGLGVVNTYIRSKSYGYFLIGFLGLISIETVHSVLNPNEVNFWHRYGILPAVDMRPPERSDMNELDLLVHQLELYASSDKHECVAASGHELNQSIVFEMAENINGPGGAALTSHFVWLGDVDRRDGPAINFPECDYVVITTPVSTHLAVREQQVVAYLAENIKAQKGIGSGYAPTGLSYDLLNGYQAYIYQKTKPIAPADWQEYLQAVRNK